MVPAARRPLDTGAPSQRRAAQSAAARTQQRRATKKKLPKKSKKAAAGSDGGGGGGGGALAVRGRRREEHTSEQASTPQTDVDGGGGAVPQSKRGTESQRVARQKVGFYLNDNMTAYFTILMLLLIMNIYLEDGGVRAAEALQAGGPRASAE